MKHQTVQTGGRGGETSGNILDFHAGLPEVWGGTCLKCLNGTTPLWASLCGITDSY